MPSYNSRVPFGLYFSSSALTLFPFASKNRPPPRIAGTPVSTLDTAPGNDRNSIDVFVPSTALIRVVPSFKATSGWSRKASVEVERRRGGRVGRIESEGPWAERDARRERKSLRNGVHRADAVVRGPA
jgi:hypothetical protein